MISLCQLNTEQAVNEVPDRIARRPLRPLALVKSAQQGQQDGLAYAHPGLR